MSYSKFKKRVEKNVDFKGFAEKVDSILVFMKMVGVRNRITNSNVFNWLAMINDDSNYEVYHLEQEILSKFELKEDDLECVTKELYELHKMFEKIVEEFEDKTDYLIFLYFDEDTRRAEFSVDKDERDNFHNDLFDYYSNFGGLNNGKI